MSDWMAKAIRIFVYELTIIFLVWLIASFINTVLHNTTSGYIYPAWNLFYTLFK